MTDVHAQTEGLRPGSGKTVETHTFVLFGATGDLARRKLYPALFRLYQNGVLPRPYRIVGIARRKLTPSEYRQTVQKSLEEFGPFSGSNSQVDEEFLSYFTYFSMDVTDEKVYCDLADILDESPQGNLRQNRNRLFYLAMAPEFFEPIATNLRLCGIAEMDGWRRLIIEKPFGRDYTSAEHLNKQLRQVFEEEEIYRIDHYLGKEMVQNLEVIRFANSIFEPLWDNKSIANVQITSSETVGVEERGPYYESSGALRDMIQNHMLQMVMMVAMEPPSRLMNEAIRDEKVKVLRSLRRFSVAEVKQNVVRGQYTAGKINGRAVPGYREEPRVAPESKTETFVAARLFIDNFRFAGVPFYLRTGKRMASKATEIVVQFRDMPKHMYFNKHGDLTPNLLIIQVSPSEGISLFLNAKRPGVKGETVIPINMEFSDEVLDSPESYERLLHDAMLGDSTFFTRWDEVALAWKFVDPMAQAFQSSEGPALELYEAGSYGPPGSDSLLEQEGFFWWPAYIKPETSVVQGITAVERPLIDVSMPIHEGMQVYKNNPEKKPKFLVTADFPEKGLHETRIHLDVHTGTHIDAPLHMLQDGATIESVPLEQLVRNCYVYDLSHVKNAITAEDLASLDISAGEFVLLKTRNSFEHEFNPEFVYVDETAAKLLSDVGISGVGVDGLGIERSQPGHPTHKALFAANAIIIEGLRLADVEEGPYEMMALPIALQGTDAAPARILLRPLARH